MLKKTLIAAAMAFVVHGSPALSSPIKRPTYTNFEVAMPADDYNVFHLTIDVADGNPGIKNARGNIGGFFNIRDLPTDRNAPRTAEIGLTNGRALSAIEKVTNGRNGAW